MSGDGVSLVAALAAGVASFASPCVLPLVPAYLSVIGGLDQTRADAVPVAAVASPRTGVTTRNTLLFILGFGAVFVLLGTSASALGGLVGRHQSTLTRASGVLIVAMALFLLGSLFLQAPGLYREVRMHPRLARLGPFAAPVAGAAFAFGWTPCVGPVVASVLALAGDRGHAAQGALLLSVYTLGLGLPFLVVAAFFDRVAGPLAWMRRHGSAVTAVSGALLFVLGVLLVLDRLATVTTLVQQLG